MEKIMHLTQLEEVILCFAGFILMICIYKLVYSLSGRLSEKRHETEEEKQLLK